MKSVEAVPAFELVLRQQFAPHITPYHSNPYISYELVQLLHMKQWMQQYQQLVLSQQPFTNVQA